MLYHQDWLVRQIQMTVQAIARIIFNKDKVSYEIADESRLSQADVLHNHLVALLDDRRVNEAEDALFTQLRPDNMSMLLVALDFYMRLNSWTDEALTEANFSREEVQDGLNDAISSYGIDI